MKFFTQKLLKNKIKIKTPKCIFTNKYILFPEKDFSLNSFNKFLIQDGLLLKNKYLLSDVFKRFDYFFYHSGDFICKNYQAQKWIIDDMVDKKLNYIYVFNIVTNLIKPPFVIKSMLVPKKIKKKTKQKYIIKILYKNDNKRLKSSYKQLYYYSNRFNDSSFKTRLYKSLTISFLDWKNSYLFKLKTMVFKKFFKF